MAAITVANAVLYYFPVDELYDVNAVPHTVVQSHQISGGGGGGGEAIAI
jgi:hypothetical protein